MNRRRADAVVGVGLGIVVLAGGALGWQAARRRSFDGSMESMMDGSMDAMHGPDPLWYVFGTLVVATAIVGLYVLVRADLTDGDTTGHPPASTASEPAPPEEVESTPADPLTPESDPQARVLDLLPDDERRVLEPVLDSPGVTQVELRDRSEFSKSKVSQTVSALEERGLLYRERQGRTYRVFPSDDLRERRS
ncbi:helix-turn-helix transcriptional regulator [Halococcoides cellulosivorans]|uniref:MarR family transcriptional regulator n=1 Tax=Halococcoides cellulosivorans TaxID=1679096 RepID=A0A2R4X1D8_9EURY|nr:MarR family transcriptional regulator [Halococcoides cellulosivorans]AWB27608.1 MarR family transcriptional regulator [Halococcoides cellulosivorans]